MIRNSQSALIKKAWKSSTFIKRNGEDVTYLSLLRQNLKRYNISVYVFKEYLARRNARSDCRFSKKCIDMVVNAIYCVN